MTLNVSALLLHAMLCAATHWLVGRSVIMHWFWGRLEGRLEQLIACPACSGFWLGMLYCIAGIRPIQDAPLVLTVLLAGLLAIVTTPVFEAVILWGLARSAINPPADSPSPPQSLPPDAPGPV